MQTEFEQIQTWMESYMDTFVLNLKHFPVTTNQANFYHIKKQSTKCWIKPHRLFGVEGKSAAKINLTLWPQHSQDETEQTVTAVLQCIIAKNQHRGGVVWGTGSFLFILSAFSFPQQRAQVKVTLNIYEAARGRKPPPVQTGLQFMKGHGKAKIWPAAALWMTWVYLEGMALNKLNK